jgi:tetratricopeptide (TPR) repeat protein
MKKPKLILGLIYTLNILAVGCMSCSSDEVPRMYERGVIKLKNEIENLDKIPLEEKPIMSNKDHSTYTGIINYGKRAEYISKNRKVWGEIFTIFDEAIKSIKLNDWQDDALFCKALGLLKMASLENSDISTDSAISAMSDFIEFNQQSQIEKWTKRQMKSVFWDKTAIFFSDSLTEKANLNAFFHIGVASLLEHKRGDMKRALEEYEKVLMLDPHSFFARQARGQIELLEKRLQIDREILE